MAIHSNSHLLLEAIFNAVLPDIVLNIKGWKFLGSWNKDHVPTKMQQYLYHHHAGLPGQMPQWNVGSL